MRRLPTKSIRSMMKRCWLASCELAGADCAVSCVTTVRPSEVTLALKFTPAIVSSKPFVESNEASTTAGPAIARPNAGCLRAHAGEIIVSRVKNAASLAALDAGIPGNTQNLLLAVHEVVMAALPNPNCAFFRRSRYGPAVRGPRLN